MLETVNKLLKSIDSAIAAQNYSEAISLWNNLSQYTKVNKVIDLYYAGFAIDIGNDIKDDTFVSKGISIIETLIPAFNNSKNYQAICYEYLANACLTKVEWTQSKNDFHYPLEHPYLAKAKDNYRNALKINASIGQAVPHLYTNYANLLDQCLGRSFEALEQYAKAIEQNPNFGMAWANKGKSLLSFSTFVTSNAKLAVIIDSYRMMKKGIALGIEKAPQAFFENELENIRRHVKHQALEDDIVCHSILPRERKEFKDFYLHFCHKERLFLNPLDQIHSCKAALYDPLHISGMLIKLKDEPKYYNICSYINQIKQEYVFARYLAAQSFYKDTNIRFVDKGVRIINTLDYAANNIFLELSKASFRISYGILDKIGILVNEYFGFGLKDRMYFHDLAFDKIKEKNGNLIPIRNPGLAALIDLAGDFAKDSDYKQLRELRNGFEHRFIKFSESHTIRSNTNNINSETNLFELNDLKILIKDMLRLTKAAIFYAVIMIDYEERKKKRIAEGESQIFEMYSFSIPDDAKGI